MHTTNGWYYGQAYQPPPYSVTRLSSSSSSSSPATRKHVATANCTINAPRARITRKRNGKRDIIRELEQGETLEEDGGGGEETGEENLRNKRDSVPATDRIKHGGGHFGVMERRNQFELADD